MKVLLAVLLAVLLLTLSATAQASNCTTVTASWTMDYTQPSPGFSGACSSTVTTGCFEHFDFTDSANPIPSKTATVPITVTTGVVSSTVTVTPINYAAGVVIAFETRACGRDSTGTLVCGAYAAFPAVTCVPGGVTIGKPTPTVITIQ